MYGFMRIFESVLAAASQPENQAQEKAGDAR